MEGKWYGHEEAIRVPLIVYDPRPGAQQGSEDLFALNIDIAPTILHMTGLQTHRRMQGRDLISAVRHSGFRRKDFFYEHTFMGSTGIPKVEGVVSRKVKYRSDERRVGKEWGSKVIYRL